MAPPLPPPPREEETYAASAAATAHLHLANTTSTTAGAKTTTTTATTLTTSLTEQEQQDAIHSFCRFLQFETVSRLAKESGAYRNCAAFLMERLRAVPVLSENVWFLEESPPDAPVVVACWKGKDESLPVLLLNSHYDVVPALEDDWTVPPFGGMRMHGKIWGRGAQDMKIVGMQYLFAIQKLCTIYPDWQPERSIYLTYVPDEEVGGAGMACFLDSALYKNLPGISLALDEGLASTSDTMDVFYGERLPWFVSVTAHGPTGHGSRFIDNTAVEQLLDLCSKAMAFRTGQRALLLGDDHCEKNCSHAVVAANQKNKKQLGDVTSLNITSLQAGVKVGDTFAFNCVPPTATCSLDIRISPHHNPSEIGDMLNQWCQECSKGSSSSSSNDDMNNNPNTIQWSFLGRGHDGNEHCITPTDAIQNKWYGVFEQALQQQGIAIRPQIFPAATDSRFLRALGIRALGFSPMRNCEILLHENDEHVPEQVYLEGISVYVGLIHALGSQGKEMDT